MVAYATRAQFYTLGLPADACVPASRSLSSILVGDSVFELPGHGFSGGEIIRFKAIGEGAALCGGLAVASLYTAEPLGSDLFRVTLAGSPVTVTSEGVGVVAVLQDIATLIDTILEFRSSYVDANAKGYTPPFKAPYPKWLILIVCKLAALDVALVLRRSNPSYNLDDIKAEADKAEAFLARLSTAETMADNPPDQTPGRPQAGARWFQRATRGWQNQNGGGSL